ncbi:MAG: FAD binding domain-containing protein, partial [Burkholderiales bacterium]|nr:FAD binding domain-containing protein [Burkholderiales bacterium]
MQSIPYVQPSILADALAALAQAPLVPLAGGTDFHAVRAERPVTEGILDLSRIDDLRGVECTDQGWRIGALTTWSDLRRQPLPSLFDGLRQAAAEIGGMQIQNAGTIGGNLCNASPAADGVPALLALSARVELASLRGTRTLPLEQFILGSRRTARAGDELLTAILLPHHCARARTVFRKLGARRYLVISIAMVAVLVEVDEAECIGQA